MEINHLDANLYARQGMRHVDERWQYGDGTLVAPEELDEFRARSRGGKGPLEKLAYKNYFHSLGSDEVRDAADAENEFLTNITEGHRERQEEASDSRKIEAYQNYKIQKERINNAARSHFRDSDKTAYTDDEINLIGSYGERADNEYIGGEILRELDKWLKRYLEARKSRNSTNDNNNDKPFGSIIVDTDPDGRYDNSQDRKARQQDTPKGTSPDASPASQPTPRDNNSTSPTPTRFEHDRHVDRVTNNDGREKQPDDGRGKSKQQPTTAERVQKDEWFEKRKAAISRLENSDEYRQKKHNVNKLRERYIKKASKAERGFGIFRSKGSVNRAREDWEEARKETRDMLLEELQKDGMSAAEVVLVSALDDGTQARKLKIDLEEKAKQLAGISDGQRQSRYQRFINKWAERGGEQGGKGWVRKSGTMMAVGVAAGAGAALLASSVVLPAAAGAFAGGVLAKKIPERLMTGKIKKDVSLARRIQKVQPQMERRYNDQIESLASEYNLGNDDSLHSEWISWLKADVEQQGFEADREFTDKREKLSKSLGRLSLPKLEDASYKAEVSDKFHEGTKREVNRNRWRGGGGIVFGAAGGAAAGWAVDSAIDALEEADVDVVDGVRDWWNNIEWRPWVPFVGDDGVDAAPQPTAPDGIQPDSEPETATDPDPQRVPMEEPAKPDLSPESIPIWVQHGDGFTHVFDRLDGAYGLEISNEYEFYDTDVERAIDNGRTIIKIAGHDPNVYTLPAKYNFDYGLVHDGPAELTKHGVRLWENFLLNHPELEHLNLTMEDIVERRPASVGR